MSLNASYSSRSLLRCVCLPRMYHLLCLSNPSVQFSSVAQSCPTLCDPMNHSTPGLPVHHQLPEFTQTHVHWVRDAIQLSHSLLSPSPPAFSLTQHQGLFKWVSSSHQVAKVLEFQLQKANYILILYVSFLLEWASWHQMLIPISNSYTHLLASTYAINIWGIIEEWINKQ